MASLTRIRLYVRDIDRSAAFYAKHFEYAANCRAGDRLTELIPRDGGARLLLHKAGKAQKLGQVAVKLVFDVRNVETFVSAAAETGLVFGSIHVADGYVFSNAKDPDGNAIQISSRAFAEENGSN